MRTYVSLLEKKTPSISGKRNYKNSDISSVHVDRNRAQGGRPLIREGAGTGRVGAAGWRHR